MVQEDIKKITLEKLIVRYMYESLSQQKYQNSNLPKAEDFTYFFSNNMNFISQLETRLDGYKKNKKPVFQNTQDIRDAFKACVHKGYFSNTQSSVFENLGYEGNKDNNKYYLTDYGERVALANDYNKIWQDYINYDKNLSKYKRKVFLLRASRFITWPITFFWRGLLQVLATIKPDIKIK